MASMGVACVGEWSGLVSDTFDADAYRRLAPRLMALAATLVGPADASDVVSATVTRLIAARSVGRIDDLEAYLTRAIVNEARSWMRAGARRSVRDGRWVRSAIARDEHVEGFGDPALTAALHRLSMRQRAVVFLTYWADLTPESVAVELGISEGSVRKHLARARASLRESLVEEHR